MYALRRVQKEIVFGAELSSLSQDESTECPNIVLKLVTELFKPGRNQELQQLYSTKPSLVEVDALCNEIDSVVTSNLRLDKYSSAVVDEALKRVFHRAQQPIIPLSVADTIDRFGAGLNSAAAIQLLAKMPKVFLPQSSPYHFVLITSHSVQCHCFRIPAQIFTHHMRWRRQHALNSSCRCLGAFTFSRNGFAATSPAQISQAAYQ